MANFELGNLVWKVTGDTRDFDKNVKKANKGATGFGSTLKKLGGLALAAFSIKAISDFSKRIVGLASDAEETANKFNVVFRGIGNASEVANDLAKNYGLASAKSQGLLADTADLLQGFGIQKEESLALSENVQKLAVDLASFTNFSGGAEGASAALTKALLGEREGVKALGVAITESELKELAKDQGLVFEELTKGEKALLTYELAVKQSANSIGDFARSQSSFANQVRIAQANIQDQSTILGESLLPLANVGVTLFNEFAESSTSLAQSIKDFVTSAEGAARIATVFGGLAGTLSVIGEIGKTAFSGLKAGIDEIIKPFQELRFETEGSGVAFNILGTLIQASISTFRVFSVAVRGGVENILNLGEAIFSVGDIVSGFIDLIKGDISRDAFGEILDGSATAFKDFGTGIVDNFSDIGSQIKKEFQSFESGAEESAKRFQEVFNNASNSIGNKVFTALTNASDANKEAVKNANDAIVEGTEEATEKTLTAWQEFGAELKSDISGYVSSIGGSFSDLFGNINKIQDNASQEELNRLEALVEAEEEGTDRRIQLEADLSKAKSKAAKDTAKRQKALGTFSAVIDTAAAIIGFLADPGGIPGVVLSALAGVTGATQIAAIQSQPLPQLANGGIIQAGNARAVAGEGSNDEAVLPLNDEMFARLGSSIAEAMTRARGGDLNLAVNVAGGSSRNSFSLDDLLRRSRRGETVINMRGIEK